LTNKKPIQAMRDVQCSTVRYLELRRQGSGNCRIGYRISITSTVSNYGTGTHNHEE
jgi:hypothetical protein